MELLVVILWSLNAIVPNQQYQTSEIEAIKAQHTQAIEQIQSDHDQIVQIYNDFNAGFRLEILPNIIQVWEDSDDTTFPLPLPKPQPDPGEGGTTKDAPKTKTAPFKKK